MPHPMGQHWPCDVTIRTLAPGPATYHHCFVTSLTPENARLIDAMKLTLALDGSFTY